MTDPIDDIMQSVAATSTVSGVLINGEFWYWDGVISGEANAYRKSTLAVAKTLRVIGGSLAALGFAGFIFGLVTAHATDVLTSVFWTTPHVDVFALAVGILASCFVWYKTRAIALRRHNIPRVTFGAPEIQSVGSLAGVSKKHGMFATFSADGVEVLEAAYELARKSQHAEVTSLHIFAASLTDVNVRFLLARLGISPASIFDPLRRKLAALLQGEVVFGDAGVAIARAAFFSAASRGARNVTALDCASACFDADAYIKEVLYAANVDEQAFHNALKWLHISENMRQKYEDFRQAAALKPTGNMNRAYTAIATPFLDSTSDDLTRDAVYGRLQYCVDREHEIHAILRAIEGGGQSAVLVGQPGVGRGTIIEAIAGLMVEERVPDILKDKRLLRLNVAHLVSAQGGIGADERFLYALSEVAMSGNIVLVIENIHELVGTGGSIDLASILAAELEKRYTFVLATTTPSAYAQTLERSSLGQKLVRIAVDEPARDIAIQILESHIGLIEHKNHVAFTYQAVEACVDLATRYLHDTVLPMSAIQIAQDTGLVVGKRPRKNTIEWVRKDDVAAQVSEQSKIPVSAVSQDERQKLLQLESRLHERVIGQEAAISAIGAALRRARTELRSGNRPIANFLFLGPTGVGKTELAKTTAEVYFGSEQSMVRFDMSEYQDQSSVARLIGGNGEAGLLTEAIRRTPFSLLLLDELEKAHPDILNLFLQVMDDGRLTDGLGRTVDFTNVILIATSNAGTQYIQDEVAKGTAIEVVKTGLMDNQLRQVYRPEFLNRFDDVIVFSPLSADDVAAIAYLMVGQIADRLKAKGLVLKIDDDAIHELAHLGYDIKFGARPLRRVLQDRVENVIAERILQGDVGRRDTVVYHKGGEVTVEKAATL